MSREVTDRSSKTAQLGKQSGPKNVAKLVNSRRWMGTFERAAGKDVLGKERTEAGKRFVDHGFGRTEERQRRIIAFPP
jgi:hypothetical protein